MHTAKEDIKVFKIVVGKENYRMWSYYYNQEYEIGKTYTSIGFMSDVASANRNGYHSYDDRSVYITHRKTGTYIESFGMLDFFRYPKSALIRMDCIIPKGSRYFLNERGEYLSSAIKPLSAEPLGT